MQFLFFQLFVEVTAPMTSRLIVNFNFANFGQQASGQKKRTIPKK